MSFLGSLIGPGLGLLGDIFGASSAASAQAAANRTNIQLQKNQQQWEEKMSNTAYQRQVADLKKAGLNPMLGYMKGSGGSDVPNVAPAHVESTGGGAATGLGRGISRFMEIFSAQQGLKNMQAQEGLTNAQAHVANTEADLNIRKMSEVGANTGYLNARTGTEIQSAANARQEFYNMVRAEEKMQAEIGKILAETRGQELSNEIKRKLAPYMYQLQALDVRRQQLGMKGLENKSWNESLPFWGKFKSFFPDVDKMGSAAQSAAYIAWLLK